MSLTVPDCLLLVLFLRLHHLPRSQRADQHGSAATHGRRARGQQQTMIEVLAAASNTGATGRFLFAREAARVPQAHLEHSSSPSCGERGFTGWHIRLCPPGLSTGSECHSSLAEAASEGGGSRARPAHRVRWAWGQGAASDTREERWASRDAGPPLRRLPRSRPLYPPSPSPPPTLGGVNLPKAIVTGAGS